MIEVFIIIIYKIEQNGENEIVDTPVKSPLNCSTTSANEVQNKITTLKNIRQKLKEENKELNQKIIQQQFEFERKEFENQNTQLDLKNQIEKLTIINQSVTKQYNAIVTSNKTIEEKCLHLEKELEKYKSLYTKLKDDYDNIEKEKNEGDVENEDLTAKNDDLNRSLNYYEEEVKNLQSQLSDNMEKYSSNMNEYMKHLQELNSSI